MEIFAQMEIEVISYLIGNPSYQKLKVKMLSYFDLYNTDPINLATILYSLNRRLSRLSLYIAKTSRVFVFLAIPWILNCVETDTTGLRMMIVMRNTMTMTTKN